MTDAEAPAPPARADRGSVLMQGLAAVLVTGVLLLSGLISTGVLGVALLALQVLLLLGFLTLVDAPAPVGGAVIAAVAALAADIAVVHDHGRLGALAGIVALSLVAALLLQLARRGRTRVTESLADTLVAVVLASSGACLLAVRELSGYRLLVLALLTLGTSLLAGRLGDAAFDRSPLAVGASRGWPGLVIAMGSGTVVAAILGPAYAEIGVAAAALLGLAVAAVAAAADLAADLAGAELESEDRDTPGPGATGTAPSQARRKAARRPVGLLLPFAAAGPVAYVAAHLIVVGS